MILLLLPEGVGARPVMHRIGLSLVMQQPLLRRMHRGAGPREDEMVRPCDTRRARNRRLLLLLLLPPPPCARRPPPRHPIPQHALRVARPPTPDRRHQPPKRNGPK